MKEYSSESRLREVLQAPNAKAMLVVGSGFTIQVTNSQNTPASWTELILHGATYAEAHGLMLPADVAKVRVGLDSDDASRLIGLATSVQAALQSRDTHEFGRWLATGPGAFIATSTELREALWSLGLPIATTNYDTLLTDRRTSQATPVAWDDHGLSMSVLRQDIQGVLHLHGVHTRPESVVFGNSGYQDLLADERAQFRQELIAVDRTLVFVGCGPGLQDPNLGELFRWLRGQEVRHEHFRLVPDEDWEQLTADPIARIVGVSDVRCGPRAGLAAFVRTLARGDSHERSPRPGETSASSPPAGLTAALAVARSVQDIARGVERSLQPESDLTTIFAVREDLRAYMASPSFSNFTRTASTSGSRVSAATEQLDDVLSVMQHCVDEFSELLAQGYYPSHAGELARRRLESTVQKAKRNAQALLEAFA